MKLREFIIPFTIFMLLIFLPPLFYYHLVPQPLKRTYSVVATYKDHRKNTEEILQADSVYYYTSYFVVIWHDGESLPIRAEYIKVIKN